MEIKNNRLRKFLGRKVFGTSNENKTPKRWGDMSKNERIAAIEFYIQETFTEEQNDNK